MAETDKETVPSAQLDGIRRRIDAIDGQIHRLLIDRGAVIDELIRVKRTDRPGAAFRPAREASMMRRLAVEHRGGLPLTAVEHIWREIITTFTNVQAPFSLAVPVHPDADALRDAVRFYFGFSVPVETFPDADAAIARVLDSSTNLAVLPLTAVGAWWTGLGEEGMPKIFARLPFIEMAGRPAAMPCYVVGPPGTDAESPDTLVAAVTLSGDPHRFARTLAGRVVAGHRDEWLVEFPATTGFFELATAAEDSGTEATETRMLGGFHSPVRFVARPEAVPGEQQEKQAGARS